MSSNYKINKIDLPTAKDIAYIDEGVGEKTILFIHGLASYGLSWQKNIEGLKENFRCIAIDLPGNGLSGRADYPYDIPFFSTVIQEFITALKLKNLCIAGHSMGGQIAINTLATHPQLADKLLLVAPAGFETFTALESSLYQATYHFFDYFSTEANSLKKSIRSSFYHYSSQADGMIDDLLAILAQYPIQEYRRMIELSIHGMLQHSVYHLLSSIVQSTLIVFGERDTLIPNRLIHPVNTRKIAEDGLRQLPNATLEMISSAGHFVQWEKAKEINNIITDFLQVPIPSH